MNDVRDAAAVRLFPPAVPLATIFFGVVLDRLWPIPPGLTIPELARQILGGVVIAVALVGLGGWSVYLLRRDGQSENPWKPTLRIIDRGPFRITRNPMYLQMVLICTGFAIMWMNFWLLLLTPVCSWLLQKVAILPEEAYLERKFGEPYLEYKRRVPRWLWFRGLKR